MSDYLSRTKTLLGDSVVESFKDKAIMIFGLGGVGGTAFECLVRSGFKSFIIVDFDKVDVTNLNRQILYTSKDIGKNKVDIAKQKALSINPDLKIEIYNEFVDNQTIQKFKNSKIYYIVDAIDKIPSKIAIVKFAQENNIKMIMSLGMGNRVDPEKVTLTRLDKTSNDALAKKIRSELRKENIDLKTINVVFSKEEPLVKSNVVSSMMMVPSEAGLLIAKQIINDLSKGE